MRGIDFLNKANDKLVNIFIDFSRKTSFCDILKWNIRLTIWYEESIK